MKFLIQLDKNQINHDFSLALIKSLEYHKWRGFNYDYKLTNNEYFSDYIPIGSNDFVIGYLQKYFNLTPKPIAIPNELMSLEYTGRNIIIGNKDDIKGVKFVKSISKVKGFTDICDHVDIDDTYLISDVIDIQSEYRCFVYKKELVGIQHYAGDFRMFPNLETIDKMIRNYHSAPVAYTLDVAITNDRTVVIEVHDFYSCGLYGFSNYRILPFMFSQWYYEFLRKNNINI